MVGSVIFSACETGGIREGEVLHPTPENAPPSDAALIGQDSLPQGLTPGALSAWRSARSTLLGARTELRIGTEDPEGPEMFGRIWDVDVDPADRVFVLDDMAQEIRIFDSGGRLVQAVGGIGDGPTEFRYANGIELLGDGRLAVSSQGSVRLKVLAESAGEWELDEIVELPAGPDDLCTTSDNRIFVSGHKRADNTLVHEVSVAADDAVGRDFGTGYQADHWLIQNQMADGWIGCLARPHRVVFAYEMLPVVRSFDPDDGTNTWIARIEDFIPPQVISRTRSDGRRAVRRGRTEVEDLVATVHGVSVGHLLLQVSRFHSRERTVTVRSFLIDAASGRGAFLGDGALPAVVSTFAGGYVAVFEDPYPRLEVRMTGGGRP